MAQSVDEIVWGEPIVPLGDDPAWLAEVKRRAGTVSGIYPRIAPVPWLREMCLTLDTTRLQHVSKHLENVVKMVTAQENSCRYCYGAVRSYMRILGYSEGYIGRIERETRMAELDEKERAVVEFCRMLARSNPRPAGAERQRLIGLGFTPLTVVEMAYLIAGCCIYNRVGTLIACPPEHGFERFANGPLGRTIGVVAALLRPFSRGRAPAANGRGTAPAPASDAPFGRIVAELDGLPSAQHLRAALEGALASTLLSRRIKALMFAVVARALDCAYTEREARALAQADGLSAADIDDCLSALGSPRLDATENRLLGWVRDTVHYRPETIQASTRELAQALGPAALLEAVGVASLANGTTRLAMLLA
jgi:alkylhydroperoxidase family enzyme